MKKAKLSVIQIFIENIKKKYPESDLNTRYTMEFSHQEATFEDEFVNSHWQGFLMCLYTLPQMDLMVSVDMADPKNESTFGNRVYSKIIEWNALTHQIYEGGELSLCFQYQSHNFDITNFKDPYKSKDTKKYRPD